MINKKIKNFIRKESIKNAPNESCGFIVEDNYDFICIPCENIAKNKKEYFEIKSIDYLNTKNKYKKIHYIYHSHTNNNFDFSEQDKLCAKNLNISIILYILKNNEFKMFDIYKTLNNYTGRYYQYKKYDCFTLIKDFYKNEKNIDLFANYYENLDEIDVKNKIYDFYKINNLEIVDKTEDLKLHDILFFNGFGTKHLGLYLEEDKILHQPMCGFSQIENYNNFYRSRTDLILRLK